MKKMKKMKKIVLLLVVLLTTLNLSSKNDIDSVLLKGRIVETVNGEVKPLPFVSVYCVGTTLSTFTDINGDYVLLLKKKKTHSIIISHVGYDIVETKLKHNKCKYPNSIKLEKQNIILSDTK